MERLQTINLISRVVKDLEAHLGVSDDSLAEYIISLFNENQNFPDFEKALKAVDLPDNLIVTLHKTISTIKRQYVKPVENKPVSVGPARESEVLSALAIHNSAPVPLPDFKTGDTGLKPDLLTSERQPTHLDDGGRGGRKIGQNLGTVSQQREFDDRSTVYDSNTPSRSNLIGPLSGERDPVVGRIYEGRVTGIKDFGCFVELLGFPNRTEGLCHVREIRVERTNHPEDVVRRGDKVYVKVLSVENRRISLSMKEVDQKTGVDIVPPPSSGSSSAPRSGSAPGAMPVPPSSRDTNISGMYLASTDLQDSGRRMRKIHSPERFELQQLISSGAIDGSMYNLGGGDEEEEGPAVGQQLSRLGKQLRQDTSLDEGEFDVDLVEEEPLFLRGQTSLAKAGSPIRLTANPDGSMSRAAMTQQEIIKERLEARQQGQLQLQYDMLRSQGDGTGVAARMNKAWADPMAAPGDRQLTADLRGVSSALAEAGVGAPTDNMAQTSAGPLVKRGWKEQQQLQSLSFGKKTEAQLSIKEVRESLPIFKLRQQLVDAVRDNQVLIVIGETGSGKTTQMTQYLHEEGYSRRGLIGCTQPRRVAATSVAARVATEMGVHLGEEVGYSIRFDDKTSPSTLIKYMTDGMLLREYLVDPTLSKYSVLILDEAHERTINTDILFGLLKAILTQKTNPGLKLIVTSATLDSEKFSRYFFEAPIFTIPGRTFPVDLRWALEPEPDYVEAALTTVMQVHLKEPPGDILVFLTGQEEIEFACETLHNRMQALIEKTRQDARFSSSHGSSGEKVVIPELIILPVYSSLPSEQQSKIFEPAPPGSRKVVIATNIAEASLTIDGIMYVIDPGFAKQKVFNPRTGMDSLLVAPISQASARQRAGRAGRTGPGTCFRLYTEASYQSEMIPATIPEIQRANLVSVVLQLKAMGVNDLLDFEFMDRPSPKVLVGALHELFVLGALDEEGLLTRLGRKMAEFPLEPQLAKVLLASVDLACGDEVLSVVSMLSVEQVFVRPKDRAQQADRAKARFVQAEGDHMTLLTVFNAWKKEGFTSAWCRDNFVQFRSMQRALEVRRQLLGIMEKYGLEVRSAGRNFKVVQKAIASGFFMKIAKKDPQEGYRTVVDNLPVFIHPSSALFQQAPEMVIYNELVMTSKEYMRNVMAVDAKWIVEVAPRFFKAADPAAGVGKLKKRVKIEPLFDRFAPKDSWRLSKRVG